jgi:membrane-bound metal-dependent hydrolase YbcI (DUF457 family)
VDPVSHAAFGRTLIAFDTRYRLGRGAAAACILGSLAPDLDLASTLQGWDIYLRAHQGGTHAVAGALACAALTATVVRATARESRWVPLFAAASAGSVGHLVLDLVAGADLRPWWPLADTLDTLPLFAMADPWLLALFVIAVMVLWHGRGRRVAATVLVAFACMGGLKWTLLARAVRVDLLTVPTRDATHVDAVFGSFRRWTFFHAIGNVAERWEIDAIDGRAVRSFRVDRRLDAAAVAASRDLPTVANLLASHGVTLARMHANGSGRYEVLWSDLRYCGATLAGSDPVCGLWFGGEYGADGRVSNAVVHVGSLVQRRSVRPPSDHE